METRRDGEADGSLSRVRAAEASRKSGSFLITGLTSNLPTLKETTSNPSFLPELFVVGCNLGR